MSRGLVPRVSLVSWLLMTVICYNAHAETEAVSMTDDGSDPLPMLASFEAGFQAGLRTSGQEVYKTRAGFAKTRASFEKTRAKFKMVRANFERQRENIKKSREKVKTARITLKKALIERKAASKTEEAARQAAETATSSFQAAVASARTAACDANHKKDASELGDGKAKKTEEAACPKGVGCHLDAPKGCSKKECSKCEVCVLKTKADKSKKAQQAALSAVSKAEKAQTKAEKSSESAERKREAAEKESPVPKISQDANYCLTDGKCSLFGYTPTADEVSLIKLKDGNCVFGHVWSAHKKPEALMEACDPESVNQKWMYTAATGQLSSKANPKACLASTHDKKVVLTTCSASDKGQQWIFTAAKGQIKAKYVNQCLAPRSLTDKAKIELGSCDHQWMLQCTNSGCYPEKTWRGGSKARGEVETVLHGAAAVKNFVLPPNHKWNKQEPLPKLVTLISRNKKCKMQYAVAVSRCHKNEKGSHQRWAFNVFTKKNGGQEVFCDCKERSKFHYAAALTYAKGGPSNTDQMGMCNIWFLWVQQALQNSEHGIVGIMKKKHDKNDRFVTQACDVGIISHPNCKDKSQAPHAHLLPKPGSCFCEWDSCHDCVLC